jgi:hypothetical protein
MAAIYKRLASLLGKWWVKAIFTAALIGLIVVWVGPQRILGSLLASDPSLVALSLVFTPAVIGLKTLRWQLLVGRRANFSYIAALRSYLAGLVLATVTPVAAGEVGRGLFVQRGNRAELTGKVVIDKLTDLVSLTGFAGVGLLLSGSPPARTVGLVLLIGVILAATLSLLARRVAQEQGNAEWRRWPWLERLRIPGILDGMAAIRPAQLDSGLRGVLLTGVCYAQSFLADGVMGSRALFPGHHTQHYFAYRHRWGWGARMDGDPAAAPVCHTRGGRLQHHLCALRSRTSSTFSGGRLRDCYLSPRAH